MRRSALKSVRLCVEPMVRVVPVPLIVNPVLEFVNVYAPVIELHCSIAPEVVSLRQMSKPPTLADCCLFRFPRNAPGHAEWSSASIAAGFLLAFGA
jgi:hypothetical protein